MKTLTVENKNFKLPSEWNELILTDLMEVCRVMLLPLDEKYKRMMLVGHFTDISYKAIRKWDENAIPEVLSTFDYIFTESRLTKNPFPEIGKMKGPAPGLSNFTFTQYFSESEPYYYLICKNKNDNDLDSLINIMYNFNGNDENKGILKALPEVEKLAIFYYYEGSSAFVKHRFRDVFKGDDKAKKPDGLEFTRLINSMNQGDLSKNEQIKKTNLYEALIFMQNLIHKNL